MSENESRKRATGSQPKRDYNPPLHVPLTFEQLVKGIVQVQPDPKPEKPQPKKRGAKKWGAT